MYWVSVIIVGIFVIALLWGIVLTLGAPFDKPKHHDNRPGSHYYESNKKRWE
jgi:hypothetical protein|tara:strand:- start:1006 stop:1161 length:156 start_codon:yes stop_codon:yes gene_type:complete